MLTKNGAAVSSPVTYGTLCLREHAIGTRSTEGHRASSSFRLTPGADDSIAPQITLRKPLSGTLKREFPEGRRGNGAQRPAVFATRGIVGTITGPRFVRG